MVANDFKVRNYVFNAASKGSSKMIGHLVIFIYLLYLNYTF